ncbi:MAG: 2-oxo acid dehydrogenase subunit E2 [Oscillospiraceae bacterium]|nr:2-oxo acid dehydrogenase subunit E2 [Oscillospiraceae bacterium]
MAERKRRWGDRRDGRWVREVTGLQCIMSNLMPNRTDCEVCLQDKIDVTDLLPYIDKKNAEHPDYKTTLFHCILVAVSKMVMERPFLNRFIQGRRTYERYEISLGFVAKRRFADGAEESLMVLTPTAEDTLDTVSRKIVGDTTEMRKSETADGGLDATMDFLKKLPRLFLMFFVRCIRWLDFWGLVPKSLTEGDPNFTSVFLSNLGSIKCPSVYHHLNNYGTNSFMVTIGTIHKEEIVMPDGSKQIRDMVDFCATLDERIADGFYFARSLKLVRHIFAHPEMLDRPIGEPSGFEYK